MHKTTQLNLLLILSFSIGCGAPAPSNPTSPSTPESTIQAMKIAAENRDALDFALMHSPDTIALMIEQQMPYCFEGYVAVVHPDQVPEQKKAQGTENERNINVYRAAKEAGIDENILNEITQPARGTPLRELYSRAAESISNKVLFFGRSLEINNELQKVLGADRDAFSVWKEADFGAIEESGDEASVKVSWNGRDTEFHFKRVDNGWLFHIPTDAR